MTDDFTTLYDADKIRGNANIPGPLVHPLAHIAQRSDEHHKVGVALGIEVPDEDGNLPKNGHDHYLDNFLHLTRSVQMKGSEQYVRISQGMAQQQGMQGAGMTPNLTPPGVQPQGNQVVMPIIVNGAKDMGKRGLKRFGWGR